MLREKEVLYVNLETEKVITKSITKDDPKYVIKETAKPVNKVAKLILMDDWVNQQINTVKNNICFDKIINFTSNR